MIPVFIEHFEEEISSFSIVVSSNIQKYFGPSIKEVYIKGKLVFIDLSSLEFSLFIVEKGRKLTFDKYRYQYMDPDHRFVFRYDNAPHHKGISSFPFHKHLGDNVVESNIPDIKDLLGEISAFITQSIK